MLVKRAPENFQDVLILALMCSFEYPTEYTYRCIHNVWTSIGMQVLYVRIPSWKNWTVYHIVNKMYIPCTNSFGVQWRHMKVIAFHITENSSVSQQFVRANNKGHTETFSALLVHCDENLSVTGGGSPAQRSSNAENFSITWRHHGYQAALTSSPSIVAVLITLISWQFCMEWN